ncbi:hypothetical protein BpHYR1_024299 [Brachionus plicatilis]|uniref:Uncharacterized protein n=1 Tax=Brachionus plicatilis TaxID=10195 RepID=A0A3M7SD07_BRAPC|nr:hypothetical protein BpHYR1_024299 [Brachionus plicatilis]
MVVISLTDQFYQRNLRLNLVLIKERKKRFFAEYNEHFCIIGNVFLLINPRSIKIIDRHKTNIFKIILHYYTKLNFVKFNRKKKFLIKLLGKMKKEINCDIKSYDYTKRAYFNDLYGLKARF